MAGYFDGDGAVYVSIRKYVLRIRISFYDSWKPQLETIGAFLESEGIKTQRLGLQKKEHGGLWSLTIANHFQVTLVIRKLLPFACKKRGDLLVALNYLEDKVTAKEAVEQLNDLVRAKRRSGFIRKFDLQLNRSEGAHEGRRRAAEAGARKRRVKVPPLVEQEMRLDRSRGSTLEELQAKYGYTSRVIRRILRT